MLKQPQPSGLVGFSFLCVSVCVFFFFKERKNSCATASLQNSTNTLFDTGTVIGETVGT